MLSMLFGAAFFILLGLAFYPYNDADLSNDFMLWAFICGIVGMILPDKSTR